MIQIKNCIALFALLASASSAFAHTAASDAHTAHTAHASPATSPEQQAWGIAATAAQASRTITLRMTDDMRFSPSRLTVKLGETVRIRVENAGQIMHELVLGSSASLEAHAQAMLQHPGMSHAAPYMAHVPPQQTGELLWTFNRPGTFDFACLIAGHYQAGMRGTITVTP